MSIKPWRWGLGIAFGGIALLVACDGANLFDPSQNPFVEPRLSLSAPSSAFAGDSVTISVSASAAQDLASLRVSVRGAATKDTTITVSGTSATANVKFGLPSILTDTLVYISAVAQDKVGNVSKVRGDTMTVVGPPAIISVTQPDSLKVGQTSSFKVRAFGTRRVAQLDLTIRGAISKDTTILVSPPANDVTQTVSLTLPALVSDTAVRVSIVARDVAGLSSVPVAAVLPVSILPPTAVITAGGVATTVAPGNNLDVTIRATSMRTITKIGVVLTGAVSKDTAIDVLPPQSDVTRTVSVRIPADVSGTALSVSAYSIDKSGTRSVPSTAIGVTIDNSVPVISSVTAPDSIGAGKTLDVRVVASGVRPLTSIELRARGAVDNVQTVLVTPNRTSVTQDFQVTVPLNVADTLLTLTAVATDAAGQKSALGLNATKIVRVADLTAPSVTATPNRTNSPAGGTVLIRVQASDNVALRQVGYAIVNPAGDTIGTTPTLAATRGATKDTTFSFIVPATLSPRTVRVLGIAVDASGRRGLSSAASLIIADSAAPAITFIAPTLNSTLPLNDSVRVQVRVQDATGIKEIDIVGQSTRVDSLGPTRTVQRFNQKILLFPAVPGTPMPRDTTVIRYLTAIPDSISEPVDIIVTAKDSLNNTSSTSTTILVGGPRVQLRQPFTGVSVAPGGTLPIQIFAVDRASGIDSVQYTVTGAYTTSKKYCAANTVSCTAYPGLRSADSIVVNDNIVIPPATPTGNITISATAWNSRAIAGSATSVVVPVLAGGGGDTSPPQVSVSMSSNDRIELRDTISIVVQAQDVGVSGIQRMGVVVTATPAGPTSGPDNPVTLYRDTLFSGTGRVGLVPKIFKLTLKDFGYDEIKLQSLPRGITFQATAFALDAAATPNCGANVTATLATLSCSAVINVAPAPTVSGRTDYYTATSGTPASVAATAVPGFGVNLPTPGARIADVVVDINPARPRMYLSNFDRNRIDVLCLDVCGAAPDSTFADSVSVGSEPWGMFINNAGDRLMVANSGGTNISLVNITSAVGSIKEVDAERILTPNASLFDVTRSISVGGFTTYSIITHDFSDRPMFLAQDASGVLVHSTKPTTAAADGTIRYLEPTPGGSPRPYESKILYTQDALSTAVDNWAVARIDSIGRRTGDFALYDHVAGNPGAILRAPVDGVRVAPCNSLVTYPDAFDVAICNLKLLGSDIDAYYGNRWVVDKVGLSDTTYVATSTDRKLVAFGEGGVGPTASIWLWRCDRIAGSCTSNTDAIEPGVITDYISVGDLIGNASERVMGIALNSNGSIGGARGSNSAYFFSNGVASTGDLRLQGLFSNGVSGGNGGMALHPSHPDPSVTTCSEATMAFVATVNRSIKIVDTFHFRQRGEVQIRDNIVGPLRASLPMAGDNAPADVGTSREILVKLYGVTGAGKATIINVRRRDLTDMQGCP